MENEDNSYYVNFESILDRINILEEIVSRLLTPELRYKRPGSDEYEKLNETLDYLHNEVEKLKNQ